MFNLNDKSYLGGFGKTGEGPCEVNFAISLSWINAKDNLIGIQSMSRFDARFFDLSTLESNEEICEKAISRLDINFIKGVLLDTNTFFGYGLFKDRYAIQLSNGDLIFKSSLGFSKSTSDSIPNYELAAMAMQGDILKHPTQRRVVVSSLYS